MKLCKLIKAFHTNCQTVFPQISKLPPTPKYVNDSPATWINVSHLREREPFIHLRCITIRTKNVISSHVFIPLTTNSLQNAAKLLNTPHLLCKIV